MNQTAQDIKQFAIAGIDSLLKFPGATESGVYRDLSQMSGLSKSMIRLFHKGVNPNPTVDSLDQLVAAVKQAMRKVAA